jgi:S-DNA-T family DNA segregation ATPase FtsK/SpoIIIE
MHRRYKLFGEAGARNIARYNELLYERVQAGEPPSEKNKPLPYIVFIIDELADLMMVSPAEVEDSISRLAALARATGIHLVLATQRPSVDVITGVIKANFPARIAFAVSSQVDSRTIIDQAGAEKLLGRGDMLYLPSDGSKAMRVQGSHLSDQEIERLVEFWQNNAPMTPEQIAPAELEAPKPEESENENEDKLLSEATRVVREYRRASVSLLQRRLSIGYSRAARLLDQLEERGIVGPSEDGRSRIVLDMGDGEETDGATDAAASLSSSSADADE